MMRGRDQGAVLAIGGLAGWLVPLLGDMQTMPGIVSNDEIRQLESLPIEAAEALFLTLMIRHHQGGIEMAEAILTMTDRDDVHRLASSIVAGQQSEIEAMQSMLKDRSTA